MSTHPDIHTCGSTWLIFYFLFFGGLAFPVIFILFEVYFLEAIRVTVRGCARVCQKFLKRKSVYAGRVAGMTLPGIAVALEASVKVITSHIYICVSYVYICIYVVFQSNRRLASS